MAEPAGGARLAATGAVLVAIASFQTGASVAKQLFPLVGPLGMVAARVGIAAIVMCAIVRPSPARLTRPVLGRLLPYGVALAAMNSFFYLSLARLPLGLAVGIEFLGPLAVALAGSRRIADGVAAVLAATGLVLLVGPHGAADGRGVAFALLAGACWAAYILAGSRVGQVLPAGPGAACGMVVAAAAVLPFAAPSLGAFTHHLRLLAPAAAVAMLSSAAPYTLEMVALRRLPTPAFRVLMSLEPAAAATAGVVFLGEHLAAARWAGIACVVAASLASVLTRRPGRV